MTTSASIKEFKNKIVASLVADDDVVSSMGNSDIEENDEAIYKYIFPYFHIPYTIESAHSYICMKVNMTGRSSRNDMYGNFSLIIWVIVNQDIMKMEGVGGATRLDHLADMVERSLAGKTFGVKPLQLIYNTEEDLDTKHRARKLTFSTMDISDQLECG